ncbi:hypothetical protein LTR16_000291 [Cryomyces antarcticus]|uniref:Arrestin C-terminal-like domain-containing protein n=1 Tax=Cryomyces antarcticus TaxID=329879 RepID=A0ABR0M8W6_9PEZI|nr:hypothetical protein LTR16_000291 [Cryomyces antarcticus]
MSRRMPSRTFVRTPQPTDILEFPAHRHPRISADLQVAAPLFVGGGSIEGQVRITVDDAERVRHKKSLAIARISIDLVGVEEMSGGRKAIFLSLGSELIDSEHPPPHNMVESLKQVSLADPFWLLTPSMSVLPFMLSLPLDTGPPPFQSKLARIRYILSVTLLVRDSTKQYLVRSSQDVSVLSVYDRQCPSATVPLIVPPVLTQGRSTAEKALMSLPSPLTASDEHLMQRGGVLETIRVTAGLHRQVWVSGTSIFVDVHVANNSRRTIKKLELNLERDILCYKHAAASTLEKSASQARIFDQNERSTLNKSVLKHGTQGWNGVEPHSTDVRTCDLEIPRGHATVKCGKYFEVRYFLNVVLSTSHTKVLAVQLPIILIHMNSLDVVPNSVAQVAAAIEEKRSHTFLSHAATQPHSPSTHTAHQIRRQPSQSHSVQGRAFAAPRLQSLERMRAEADDMQQLGYMLDASPRKAKMTIHKVPSGGLSGIGVGGGGFAVEYQYHTPPSNRKGRVFFDGADANVEEVRRRLRTMRSFESGLSKRSGKTSKSQASKLRVTHSALGHHRGNSNSNSNNENESGNGNGDAGPLTFREKLERSRFEFKKPTRKKSERWKNLAWWEGKKDGDGEKERERERERERKKGGWI